MKSSKGCIISKGWVLADKSRKISISISEKLRSLEEFVLKLVERLSTGIRNASGLVKLRVGLEDEVGNAESFLENGVDHEFVIVGPVSSEVLELGNGFLSVVSKAVSEISSNWGFNLIEELREEDESEFVVKVEVNVGVILLDSLELRNKFLNEETEGKFTSD